jgi:uncharacterized lipoprotein
MKVLSTPQNHAPVQRIARTLVLLLCAAGVLTASGCSWLRGKSNYENSAQSRPLEVPPDLDAPVANTGLEIPAVAADAGARSGSAAAASPSDQLLVDDSVAGTFRRLGLALQRIDGATIEQRAELLSVYTVRYQGETFLLRVQEGSGGSRVSAVSAEGVELSGGAAAALLGALRQRLG